MPESTLVAERLTQSQKKPKIFIIDDHPVVREGLSQLISKEIGSAICVETEDVAEINQMISLEKPDAIVIDISLKHANGIDLIKSIRSQRPKLPILVLSMHDESLYAERVIHAGAQGYIMKGASNKNVLTALHRVLKGELYVSDKVADKIVSKLAGGKVQVNETFLGHLSDRELEVFNLIGRGLKTREIAERLYLSTKTINTYREHIKEKLKLESSIELIQHAIHWIQNQTRLKP